MKAASMRRSQNRPWLHRTLGVAVIAALAIGAAACGSSSDKADNATGDAAQNTAAAQDTDAGTGENADGTSSEETSATPATQDAQATEATPSDVTLTVYSGQHDDFAQALADGFTKSTGIKVTVRSGDDAELANQILEEGDGSPADVFISEEPGPVAMVAAKGFTSAVDTASLDAVDQRLVPSTGTWLPYAARARVMYYNPTLIDEADLPTSIMDLADPKWKGQFAYAPSGAFTSTVSYLIDSIGSEKTLEWLEAIKANGINEQKNGKVRDSVEAGQHPFGLSNHYYWYILAAKQGGADKLTSKVHFFTDREDAGGLLLTSGAAVLKSSAHQAQAQQFLAWLTQKDGGQEVVADGTAAQFPVVDGVTSASGLPALSELTFPTVDPTIYSDTAEAKDLIIKSGIA